MMELLFVLLQLVMEVLGEALFSVALDSVFFPDFDCDAVRRAWIYVVLAWIGILIGGLSVAIAPNLVLPWKSLRIINMCVAPLVAGGVLWWAAHGRSNRFTHFWCGFVFALFVSGTRLAFAG